MGTLDILSSEYARNPYPYYKQMRDDHPVLFHPATQSYIISRYADIEQHASLEQVQLVHTQGTW